jgi:GNAT superfamily N-acetyltransferase
MNKSVEIIEFEKAYASDFARLNFEWLEKYFYVEDYDKKVLGNPQKYILEEGGFILFAKYDGNIVGTVALIRREDRVFELSKMAVTEEYQGLKIGQKLMYASIHFSAQKGIKRLYLESNTKLEAALRLYRKVGFKEIPVASNSPYKRSNINMELYL